MVTVTKWLRTVIRDRPDIFGCLWTISGDAQAVQLLIVALVAEDDQGGAVGCESKMTGGKVAWYQELTKLPSSAAVPDD